MAWGGRLAGDSFLQKIGAAAMSKLKERVAAELKTTFASRYAARCRSSSRWTQVHRVFAKAATGHKYLINPNKTSSGSLAGAATAFERIEAPPSRNLRIPLPSKESAAHFGGPPVEED